jgi:Xaa-Pro aminopeptidase
MSPSIADRLTALRRLMAERGLDAWIVPSEDPHQSEYVPAWWCRREWISGFTGSCGLAAIGRSGAWLWTDSRYWLQAGQELDPACFELAKQDAPGMPPQPEWLARTFGPGAKVGVDPRTISLTTHRQWEQALARVAARLVLVEDNLVDAIWDDRPPVSQATLRPLDLAFSGEAPSAKLARLQTVMESAGVDALVVTPLDQVAWTLDLRGRDVEHTPVFASFLIIEPASATLFVDERKVTAEVHGHLPDGVSLRGYDDFAVALGELAGRQARTWVDPSNCSAWVVDRLRVADHGATLHEAESPIALWKACKNPTEVQGARACHVRDGVALVRFLTWLEDAVDRGEAISEIEAADQLEAFRAAGEHFQGPSFESISAFGSHGAIVHYRPGEEGDRVIDRSSLYLIDSGGQYLDGTTDVTRTTCFGEPSAEQREIFTRVLRGHVALARARFPEGTSGRRLDVIARQPLWEVGLNYGHGTGHGVGSHLCVHEGPQRLSEAASDVPLQPGMIVSNEPGCYRDGEYGIRIESLVVVEPRPDLGDEIPGPAFLGFETLTLCPIDRGLMAVEALADHERAWIDAYHARVREALSPHLDEPERAWLAAATEPLPA